MPTFDFLSYLPAYAELTPDQIAAARAKIETIVREMSPDLDMRPGSPFGDLAISQLALVDAARSVAASRMLNDLDTESVGRGVIYNCDVARAFINNFALASIEDVKARGLVRLTFDRSLFLADSMVADSGYLIVNRGVQFLFNSTDVFKVSLAVDSSAVFVVWKPGMRSTLSATSDQFFAQEGMDGDIYVDVPVLGTMVSPILDGAAGLIDKTVTALKGVAARADFLSGFPADDVPALARRSRRVAYASSLTCKAGAAGFVLTEFPSVTVVSPVTNGDDALTRGTDQSLFLLQRPCLDVYVRSSVVLSDTLVLRLKVFPDGGGAYAAAGPVTFNHIPIRVTGLSLPAVPTTNVSYTEEAVADGNAQSTLISSSLGEMPGEVSRTSDELFYVAVRLSGADAVKAIITEGEDDYVLLAITYEYDPVLIQVQSVVQSPRHAPAGVSVKSRGFCPIEIDNLVVNYIRSPGSTVNIGQAKEEILAHVADLGWPDTFTRTGISDSVLYAGGRALRDLTVNATVRTSVADVIREDGGQFSTVTDYASIVAELDAGLEVVNFALTDEVSLNVDNVAYAGPDFAAFATWSEFCTDWHFAKGNQTARWLLAADALSFEEVRS